ncbi:MAG: collagen-like protein [Gammaproteobacteria bacterium]|nr:collagen-like protein [Gammaproteobacteria bacterium]MBT4491937.1 collagen-like protein [Gammaproteobacteria bacterium]MBT7369528.1 collagen-like protein [Gammaproteobacteria bacterium]
MAVELPGISNAFSYLSCSSLPDGDVVTADLSLVLDAGSYSLSVSELNGNKKKVKVKHSAEFIFTYGIIGPQGETGETGAEGPQGDRGPQGIPGPQGDQGLTGLQGPEGDRGQVGEQGSEGPEGPQGERGPQGLAGNDGSKGDQGPMGSAGPRGNTGATGAKGATGAQGEKGDKGDKGATGVPGPAADHSYSIQTSPWSSCGIPTEIDWTDIFAYTTWLAEIGYAQCEILAHCPPGLQVVGGGIEISGRDALEALNSHPVNNASWLASVRYHAPVWSLELGGLSYRFRAYAICANLPGLTQMLL